MSYLRNSRFRGIFAVAAALPSAPVELGSTAYVNDTGGLSGGAASVAGHVFWDGSAWIVFDLDPVAAVADQNINGGSSPVVVDGTLFTPTAGNNFNITPRTVFSMSSSATVPMVDRQGIRVNAAGGSVVVTLTASGPSVLRTWVKRLDQSANTVTLVFASGTIDNVASVDLLGVPAIPGAGRGEGVELVYDPANPTDLLLV